MAITSKNLQAEGFSTHKGSVIFDNFDYEFVISEQTLYFINDGFGEPEMIGRYTKIEELFEALESLTGKEIEELKNA
jgi:hypothetical protein